LIQSFTNVEILNRYNDGRESRRQFEKQ
jgi:hypothetical protein